MTGLSLNELGRVPLCAMTPRVRDLPLLPLGPRACHAYINPYIIALSYPYPGENKFDKIYGPFDVGRPSDGSLISLR